MKHQEAFNSQDAVNGRQWIDDRGNLYGRSGNHLLLANAIRFSGWSTIAQDGTAVDDPDREVYWRPESLTFAEAFYAAAEGHEVGTYNSGRYSYRINDWRLECNDHTGEFEGWLVGWPISIHQMGGAWFHSNHADAPPRNQMLVHFEQNRNDLLVVCPCATCRTTFTGYNDDYFFDKVNEHPRLLPCGCGKQWMIKWTRRGVLFTPQNGAK